MSPSEHDLRRALRDGEGDRPDLERTVAAGAAARARRRSRVLQVAAAAVLVVAAGGITAAVVTGDDTTTSTAAGGAQDSAQGSAQGDSAQRRDGIAAGEPAPGSTAGSTAPSSATPTPPSQARPAACPSSFPQRALPGGGTAQSGSGPLFDRPAAAITVCVYGSPLQQSRPDRFTVTGSAASELQRSLENAPASPRAVACGAVRADDRYELALVAVDAAGTALRTVTTILTLPVCDTRTTNGSAVRFGWVPPDGVRQRIYAANPQPRAATLPARTPSGHNIGSPVR